MTRESTAACSGSSRPTSSAPLKSDVAVATIGRIRDELLRPTGGVRRYQGDTFYGGAEWILLAASLGHLAAAQGEPQLADRLLTWIEASATRDGHLPEQIADDVQSPHMLRHWRKRWGQTATPLLWSHAMHLVLLDELGRLPIC